MDQGRGAAIDYAYKNEEVNNLQVADLVYVMGPSGAGKDAVLRTARSLLTGSDRIAFAHRYVTRPPDAGHENFVSLTAAEFEARREAGFFAFHWRAYGTEYGIGAEIDAWRRVGFVVVVSGSREHFSGYRARPPGLVPVLVTAPHAVLAQRLAERGREDPLAQAERLRRSTRFEISGPDVLRIDNTGTIAQAAAILLDLLRQRSRPNPPRRPLHADQGDTSRLVHLSTASAKGSVHAVPSPLKTGRSDPGADHWLGWRRR